MRLVPLQIFLSKKIEDDVKMPNQLQHLLQQIDNKTTEQQGEYCTIERSPVECIVILGQHED